MIKLGDILKEVKANYKTTTKKSVRETAIKSMQLFVIEDVLSSGAFNSKESIALREFFVYRKSIPMLNENTVQLINKEMLKEGFFDWLKEKGSQFKDALSGGWDKLKAAWSNFKDFVASIVLQLKEAMKQIFELSIAKLKAAFNWGKDIASKVNDVVSKNQEKAMQTILVKSAKKSGKTAEDLHKSLPKELNTLGEQKDYIVEFVTNNIISLKDFASKAIKGEAEKTPDIEESIGLFKDKSLVETLIKITESALDHPEDVLKKWPKLHKVVKVIMSIFKWTFGIFGTLVQKAGELISKTLFGVINTVSKFIKGPVEASGYAACAALMGEFAEIAGHNLHDIHEVVSGLITFVSNKIGLLVPILLPYIKVLEITFQVVGLFFFIYAIVTTIMNTIVPAFKTIVKWLSDNPDAFKGLESMSAK
jgi:hypothetical protein